MTSHKQSYLDRNQQHRRALGHPRNAINLLQTPKASRSLCPPLSVPHDQNRVRLKKGGKPNGGRTLDRQRGSNRHGHQAPFLLHASTSRRPANSTSAHPRDLPPAEEAPSTSAHSCFVSHSRFEVGVEVVTALKTLKSSLSEYVVELYLRVAGWPAPEVPN
jgi:hypothetical protein